MLTDVAAEEGACAEDAAGGHACACASRDFLGRVGCVGAGSFAE